VQSPQAVIGRQPLPQSRIPASRRPTKSEVAAATDLTIPDLLGPGLRVLFCGINPGLYSAAVGHHYGRPGNRFWKALSDSGLTNTELSAYEENRLLESGIGLTDLVARASAAAAELTKDELGKGGEVFAQKVAELRPQVVAICGITAYRTAYRAPKIVLGLQAERIACSPVWVLPNTSGLNAHYTREALAAEFRKLRLYLETPADRLGG
jgi:TDG/mug DNA glycosylase family protein